ncbi:MAG: DUF2156 domain-containing protein [Lachnospiraceae bacterium]|nr:DUF2156 domain-containing protein [Lachnospiraceae bacterium]
MDIYKPSLENIGVMKNYLEHNQYFGCELTAANNILWSGFYDTSFVIVEDMLSYCKIKDGKPLAYTFPVGEHDPKVAFDRLCQEFKSHEQEERFYLVHPEMFEQIEKWYPGKYKIDYNRDEADYLYEYKTLSELKGKKLHGKRNHINRFEENYPDYSYETIDDENYMECIEMAYNWEKDNNPDCDEDKIYERDIIELALKNREKLGLIGGLIRIENRVIAFTLGEPINDKCFVVHFEKAYADIQGAYPMINREFVRRQLKGYKYINREEDLGIPGLRHAKTSYQPIRLIDKGTVTKK